MTRLHTAAPVALSVRTAVPGDADAITRLDAECFGASAWSATSWSDEFARLDTSDGGDRRVLVATTPRLAGDAPRRRPAEVAGHAAEVAVGQATGRADDPVAGYVVLIVPADLRDPVDLTRIAVAPGLRRTGIGERLIAAALDAVAGRTVLLEVAEGNEAAIGLYRRAGFGEISRRRGYYGADGDALVMCRPGTGGRGA